MLPRVDVGPHGHVILMGCSGGDSDIASAARTSTGRSSAPRGQDCSDADRGLIDRLLRDGHTVPFEHVTFHFNLRLPIFVARQLMRHRFSSFSEESGRYVELKDEYYIPGQIRLSSGKAMDYSPGDAPPDTSERAIGVIRAAIESSRLAYEALLEAGVAKEQARIVLPVAQYTTVVWTVNALGLMNFLRLRMDHHAQAEIREYANALGALFGESLPATAAAFSRHWLGSGTPPAIV